MISKLATRPLVAWIPAALMILASLCVVAGISIVSNATAEPAGTVDVTGTVGGGVFVGLGPDTATCTGAGAETLTNFASSFAQSDGCTVKFGSNNTSGTELTFVDADGQAPFFCTKSDGTAPNPAAGGDCTTANFPTGDSNFSVKNAPADRSACNVSDCFGLALKAVAGDAGIGATYGSAVANPSSYSSPGNPVGSDSAWSPIDGTARQMCHTTGPNSVSTDCTFAFGGQGSGASQAAGSYGGRVSFTATTLP